MTVPPLQQAFGFMTAKEEGARRRNLVIEAGAGTGKTTAIVAGVLELLLENEDLSPERIVLVTFTEKAAGEIADRIHHALAELESRFDDEQVVWPVASAHPQLVMPPGRRDAWRRACVRQLERIDSLRSQTIHSFCQSLLRQFPIEAGLDPQFRIIEGFERSLLHERVYDAWVDEETRTHLTPQALAEWEILLAHAGYLFQIRNMIFSLVERRDLLLESPDEQFGELRDVTPSLIDALETIRKGEIDERAPAICRYVRSTNVPSKKATIDEWIEYFAPIAQEIRTAKLTGGKRNDAFKDALKVLRAGDLGRSIHDRLVSHRAAMALLALTRRFVAYLDREKRRLGVVDFDDLLLRTLALLEDDGVLARVRAQFDFIFVDEFQDTDRTQARILERLARDRAGRYVEGKMVLVGDPKQSIYAFRRADPQTYYEMTQRLIAASASTRPIVDQYRSDPPLLDAINAVFARLFPEREHDPNVFRPSYRELRAGKKEPERDLDARITFLHASHDDDVDRYLAEAEAIAEWIESRRAGSGDLKRFAILFRRLTHVDDYLDTFARYGIDVVLPPAKLFLDRRAPVDLLAVLRAIGYPFDRGAEISAARSPYFALTDEEIAAGVIEDRQECLSHTAWQQFRDSLGRLREASRYLTVSQLIDLVIETTGIESVYDAAIDGDRSRLHLDHVRRIAFEYDRKVGGSVRQFVDEIARRRSEPDEIEPSLIDERQNALRILTVHAAKGLEFDTVIIPDLGFSRSAADSQQLFATEDPARMVLTGPAQSLSANFCFSGEEKLKRVASHRDDAETTRLFYVAVTRARHEVVFVCNTAAFKKKGFYGCVAEAFGFDKETLDHLWSDGREVREIAIGGAKVPVAFEKLPARRVEGRKRARLRDAALEAALRSGEIEPLTLPSPPPIPLLSRAEAAIARARSRNRAAGLLLHRVLECWDGESDAGALVDRLSAEQGTDPASVERVQQRLATIRRSAMIERIGRAETAGREMSVRFADTSGVIVERRIDRLIRENGREIVIDYKSGAPDEARLTTDREQVTAYCRAISAITGRMCEGILWYVDLENDRVVEV